jgi:hypothetical protein
MTFLYCKTSQSGGIFGLLNEIKDDAIANSQGAILGYACSELTLYVVLINLSVITSGENRGNHFRYSRENREENGEHLT